MPWHVLILYKLKTMKVLVATDKPFAKIAVDGIRKEIEVFEKEQNSKV